MVARGHHSHTAASYLLDPLIKYYMIIEFCDQEGNTALLHDNQVLHVNAAL